MTPRAGDAADDAIAHDVRARVPAFVERLVDAGAAADQREYRRLHGELRD